MRQHHDHAKPPLPPPPPPGVRARVVCSVRRPSCTGSPPLPPSLPRYCYRFSASPSRSKRLEVGREGDGNELAASRRLVSPVTGGREGGQASAPSSSLSLPPQCLPKPKNGRLRRERQRWKRRRAEQSSQQRAETIVTWLSWAEPILLRHCRLFPSFLLSLSLSLSLSLEIPFHPSIRASRERERERERMRVRLLPSPTRVP